MVHTGDGEVTLKKIGVTDKPMIQFTIQERLLLGNLLPEKGNLITLTYVKDINDKIKFTQEEIRDCNLRYDDTLKTYSWSKNLEKFFDFTKEEINLFQDQINKLDQEASIPIAMFDLVKKIKEYK